MDAARDNTESHALLEQLRGVRHASVIRRFWHGLALPFRSIALLFRNRNLWALAIVPALINLLLFGGAVYLVVSYSGTVAELLWVDPKVSQWSDWFAQGLWYVLVTLIAILSIGAAYIFVLLIGGIIASPFNDALSVRVEALLLSSGEPARRDESAIWGGIRALASSIFILGSYVIIIVPILFLNMIPVVGQVAATAFGTIVSSLFLAMEYTDAPIDRRGRDLRAKFELIERHRTIALGFGLGASLLLWLPFVNFLTIPIVVSGGTVLGIVLDEWEGTRV